MKTVCVPLSKYISEFRDKEKFLKLCCECKNYNNLWACPPYPFDNDEVFAPYTYIYVFANKISPSENFRETRAKSDTQLLELEAKHFGSRAFFAGSCIMCDECTKPQGKECTKPHKMRYSLEAMGFDMCKTTKELLGIEIKWGTDGTPPEYYTLVSALCTSKKIDL